MDWGNAEWDADCVSILPNYVFDETKSNKKNARKNKKKKKKKISSNTPNEINGSAGKFVKIQKTNNSDNWSLASTTPSLQKNKRKSFAVDNIAPKKRKVNNNDFSKDVSIESHNFISCEKKGREQTLHQPEMNKIKKKKRNRKKKTHMTEPSDDSNSFQASTKSQRETNEANKLSSNKKKVISKKEAKKINTSKMKVSLCNQFVSEYNMKKSEKSSEAVSGDIVKSETVPIKSPYKIQQLKQYLKKHHISAETIKDEQTSTNPLRERMLKKLQASHFRYLNEQLYNSKSNESMAYFQDNLAKFRSYHEGYRHQVAQWPLNPLNVIINSLKKKPSKTVIADFGCGEAHLAKSLPDHKVYSFDFVATCDLVTPCDMANTPLENGSVDIVVFCLSLMGSNLSQYILEANRVLRDGGMMMIAEVESRFESFETFIQDINKFGFKNTWKDLSHKIFYFLYFKKVLSVTKSKKLPNISLKSCLYKKR